MIISYTNKESNDFYLDSRLPEITIKKAGMIYSFPDIRILNDKVLDIFEDMITKASKNPNYTTLFYYKKMNKEEADMISTLIMSSFIVTVRKKGRNGFWIKQHIIERFEYHGDYVIVNLKPKINRIIFKYCYGNQEINFYDLIIALGDGIKDLVEQEKGWKHE